MSTFKLSAICPAGGGSVLLSQALLMSLPAIGREGAERAVPAGKEDQNTGLTE